MGSQSKNNEENSSKTQNSNSCLREEQGDIWEDLFLIFGIQNCFWMVCVESCSVGSLCGQWRERLLQGVAGVDSEGRFSLTKRALSTAANGAWGEYSSVWFVAQIFVKACWLLSQHLEKPPSKFNWCSKKRFVCGTHACVCCPSSVKMSVHHLFLSCPAPWSLQNHTHPCFEWQHSPASFGRSHYLIFLTPVKRKGLLWKGLFVRFLCPVNSVTL